MLKETLEHCVDRINKHRSFYEQNETAVRSQIVEPILRGLGWNTEKPEEVQPNVSTEEGVPDYSLLKSNRKVLFVEAKNLSVDIGRKEVIGQLARYCFGEGMDYGVLTNGASWILFRAFEKDTKTEDRVVWKTNIVSDKLAETIRRLSTISKESIENIDELIKKLPILDEIWQSLLAEPGKMIEGLIPVFERQINERYSDYEFESHEIEDFLKGRVEELITTPKKDGNDNSDGKKNDGDNSGRRGGKKVLFKELIKEGLVRDGQTLYFYYNQDFQDEQAEIVASSNKLKYKNKYYSTSDLAKKLIKEHGGPEHERQGPLHWKTNEGKLLHELNEKVREKRGDRK